MAEKKTSEELRGALDHPVVFTLLITLTVIFWMAIMTWVFKAINLPAPAGLAQHP